MSYTDLPDGPLSLTVETMNVSLPSTGPQVRVRLAAQDLQRRLDDERAAAGRPLAVRDVDDYVEDAARGQGLDAFRLGGNPRDCIDRYGTRGRSLAYGVCDRGLDVAANAVLLIDYSDPFCDWVKIHLMQRA